MTQVLAIVGAVTPPGRLDLAINTAIGRARAAGLTVDSINLGRYRIPFADGSPNAGRDDDVAALEAQVKAAEAVIIASPVYRASMTGALKNFLDLLPIESLQGKAAGIVTMGASDHHFLGAEGHLRDVLAWFGAFTAPVSIYLTGASFADGKPTEQTITELDQLVETVTVIAEAARGRALGPRPLAALPR